MSSALQSPARRSAAPPSEPGPPAPPAATGVVAAAGRERRRRGALLSGVLALAVVLASTPLSLLIADLDWLRATVNAAVVVCGIGVLGRLLLRRTILVPLLQAVGLALLVLAVESGSGIAPRGGPVGLIGGQPRLIVDGFTALTMDVPPVVLTPEAFAVLIALIGLVVLALDVLLAEGGRTGVTAVLLLGFQLVPALMHPAGVPWYVIAGPTLGALLVLAAGSLPLWPARPQGGGARTTNLRPALAGILCALLVAAATPLLAGVLPRADRPVLPLDIASITGAGSGTAVLGPTMIDDSISVRRDLLQAEETAVLSTTTDAPEPDYLRLRTLREFTGTEFVAGPPEAEAGADFTPRIGGPTYITAVSVRDLVSDRLPLPAGQAFVGMSTNSLGAVDSIAAQNSELALLGGAQDLSGWGYEVYGLAPEIPAETLRGTDVAAAAAELPPGYLRIEAPGAVGALADQIVVKAGAVGGYESALALEDYFHGFTYSLTARTPPGQDPIQSFLTDRTGYCEQFAGTFALMMNHLGYPTRVSIGFTAGTAEGPGRVVTNRNAHAWPEVWFGAELGWVRFEPTPATAGNGVVPPPITADDPVEEETTIPAPEASSIAPEESSAAAEPSAAAPSASPSGQAGSSESAPALPRIGAGALIVIALLLVAAGAAATVRQARHRAQARREAQWEEVSGDPAGAADPSAAEASRRAAGLLAWSELETALRRRERRIRWLGWTGAWGRPARTLRLDPSRPPAAALADLLRAADADPEHPGARRIAEAVSAARYAPPTGASAAAAAGPAEAQRGAAHPLRADVDAVLEIIRSRPGR